MVSGWRERRGRLDRRYRGVARASSPSPPWRRGIPGRNVLALRCPSNTASHATSRDLPHCKCASRGSVTSRVQSGRLRANGEEEREGRARSGSAGRGGYEPDRTRPLGWVPTDRSGPRPRARVGGVAPVEGLLENPTLVVGRWREVDAPRWTRVARHRTGDARGKDRASWCGVARRDRSAPSTTHEVTCPSRAFPAG